MRRILLLEDDNIQTNHLKKILSNYSNDIQVSCASTISDAKKLLTGDIIFDAFFIDISLQKTKITQDGLHFASQLQKMPRYQKTPVLFITAFPEYIYSAVNQFHCFAYIVKPYTEKDIYQQLDSLFKNRSSLFIKTTDSIHIRIPLDSLQYIHSNGRYLTFVTTSCSYRSRQYTLKKLLELLPKEFVRCHKSYIINQAQVNNFDFVNRFAHMELSNEIIPLSRDFHM